MRKRRKVMYIKPIIAILIVVLVGIIYFISKKNEKNDIKEEKAKYQEKKSEIENIFSKKINKDSAEIKEIANQEKFVQLPINKKEPFIHLAKSTITSEKDKARINKLPEILQDSVAKYPETKNEILKYFTWKSDPKNYNLTGVYKKGDIPRFIQWDSRWGFEPIGDSYIAHSACGPVAMSSVYIHFTGDNKMNPVEMSKWAVKEGYYYDDFGTSGYIFEEGAKKLGLKSHIIPFEMDEIKRALDNGDILVLHVKKGDFTHGGHYIMLIGYDKDDKLIIHDVNSPNNSQKKWGFDRVEKQVTTVWAINE